MIKVVKEGMLKRVTCSHCNSLLEYDGIQDPFCDDIRYDVNLKTSIYSWYIECPVCSWRIKVEERYSRG